MSGMFHSRMHAFIHSTVMTKTNTRSLLSHETHELPNHSSGSCSEGTYRCPMTAGSRWTGPRPPVQGKQERVALKRHFLVKRKHGLPDAQGSVPQYKGSSRTANGGAWA